jgi:hypothetical protein
LLNVWIFFYYFLYIMSTNSCSTNTLQLQMLGDLPAQPPITFDLAKETREGWPLLTVETDMHGDSKITNERGPSLAFFRRAGTIDFFHALAALVSPVENIIFLDAHFFTLLVSIAHQTGQAGVLGHLSLCLRIGHSVMLQYLKYLQYVIVLF